MRNELDRQKKLKELLKYYYKDQKETEVYAGNEFKRKDGQALNRPDLIITNCLTPSFKFKTGQNIAAPIGIELKDTKQINDTTSGILQAKEYLSYNYLIRKNNKEIKLNTMAFATSNSIKNGTICKKFEDNKVIERFSWKMNIPILINHDNILVWSFRNKYFTLKGKLYGRFGKNAKFYKY